MWLTRPDYRQSDRPAVAVHDSVVHVVWLDSVPASGAVHHRRSVDAGASWEEDQVICNSGSSNPLVAATGSLVYVVWSNNQSGNDEIFIRRSTDEGLTWESASQVTADTEPSWNPTIAVSESTIYLAWEDKIGSEYNILTARSTDAGRSWIRGLLVTDTFRFQECYIDAHGAHAFLAYTSDCDGSSDPEVFIKHSDDAGATWSPATRLSDDTAQSSDPAVAVSERNVHVAWTDNRAGWSHIYYRMSSDRGNTWHAELQLSPDSFHSYYPSLALAGTRVHVVWMYKPWEIRNIVYRRDPVGNVSTLQDTSPRTPKQRLTARIIWDLRRADVDCRLVVNSAGRAIVVPGGACDNTAGSPPGVYFALGTRTRGALKIICVP